MTILQNKYDENMQLKIENSFLSLEEKNILFQSFSIYEMDQVEFLFFSLIYLYFT